jgi:hypothetical protein
MRNIIQNGGEWFAEAQRRVQSILPGKRRDGDKPDAEPEPAPEEAAEADSGDSSDAHKKRSLAALREWTLSSRTALDEWQRRVDEKIRTAIEGISPFSGVHRDVRALSDRIAELEAKLAELESHD